MVIIWGFGRLSPLTHARLNRMSSGPPVPPFQLPRLTECLCSLPTAVTNPSMPGMRGTRDAQANKLPGRFGWRKHAAAMERSLGTSAVARLQSQDWFGLTSCALPVDLTYALLMCQHLYKKYPSASDMGGMRERTDWPRAILPDALPQHARLSVTSTCSAAPALIPLCWAPMRRDAHRASAN